MAKKKKEAQEAETSQGEQMDLIDVQPENAKAIIAEARVYKKAQETRLRALAKETASKQKILSFVRDANLQRLDDGSIRFKADGFDITVKPRDELVTVKEKEEQPA
jgi:hypothetical protein